MKKQVHSPFPIPKSTTTNFKHDHEETTSLKEYHIRKPVFGFIRQSNTKSSLGNNSGLEIIPVLPLKRARKGVENL
jgi:hypothetical protein